MLPLKNSPVNEIPAVAALHNKSQLYGKIYLESKAAAVKDIDAVASLRI
jgi:hypothetical protein